MSPPADAALALAALRDVGPRATGAVEDDTTAAVLGDDVAVATPDDAAAGTTPPPVAAPTLISNWWKAAARPRDFAAPRPVDAAVAQPTGVAAWSQRQTASSASGVPTGALLISNYRPIGRQRPATGSLAPDARARLAAMIAAFGAAAGIAAPVAPLPVVLPPVVTPPVVQAAAAGVKRDAVHRTPPRPVSKR